MLTIHAGQHECKTHVHFVELSEADSLQLIHIYDISSSKWYTQNATGLAPEPRRQFCAGATWADDHSSYNM